MPARDPNTVAANWAARLGQSQQKITDGINAVTVAPGQMAARQKQVWANNVVASQDKWASRVAGVSLQEWQQAAINKGVSRIGPGAQAAQGKFAAFMGQLLPYVERGKQSLPPRGDINANIARMTQWVQYMSNFSKNRTA